ncbi:hypothetical protein KSF_068590 [Reticulibacter mediterranei]|uniref:Uncharacterized protein n=1 Tax=Reticulibacter mediterranei TaxID=2778369 RepID=A0A8J3IV83_9CHLR|nr:hypothetical protein KSF_068590 [Reticulibacter mediterranei]
MVGEYRKTGIPYPDHSQAKYPYQEYDPDSQEANSPAVRSAQKVDTEGIEEPAEPVAAMALTAYDMAEVMEATRARAGRPLAHFPDHTASYKIPVAQMHPALVKVIAVLRFPQSCPRTLTRTLIKSIATIV